MADKAGPKRVALFLPDLGGGGAERVVLAEARELVRRGHAVDLVLAFGGGVLLDLLPPKVRRIELKAQRLAASLWPLVRYLRSQKPDALHATMWPSTVIAIAAHRLARSKARLIVSDQVTLSQQISGSRQRVLLKYTTSFFYPLADVRVQCSAVAADDLAELGGLPRDSIEVITNPVEPPATIETRPDIEALWAIPRGERIITIGGLKDQKNHVNLLRAFERLERPEAKLMILGEGALRAGLEALASELAISDRLIMPGFALNQWPFLASADLFVLSSDYEGFPLVLAEAMAAGLRVVSTDCPSGPAELLDNGKYGRLVPCGNPKALAKAMTETLQEPVEQDRQKARAIEMAGPAQISRYCDQLTGQAVDSYPRQF